MTASRRGRANAVDLPGLDLAKVAGAGDVMMATAAVRPVPAGSTQTFTASTGVGTLESARGDSHVILDGVALKGEKDIFGTAFSTAAWAKASAARTAWSGGKWMGVAWAGDGWTTANGVTSWSGRGWSSRAWSGGSWNGRGWSGQNWSGTEWGSGS